MICLMLLGATALLVPPLWSSAQTVKDEIAISQRSFDLRSRRRVTDEDEQRYATLQKLSGELGTLFVNSEQGVALLETLERAADSAAIDIKIQFVKDPAPNKRQRLSLQLTVTGQLTGIGTFLKSLEQQAFFIAFNGVAIDADVTKTDQVKAALAIETLWE